MKGLEIIMDIDTLEIFEVINHDQEMTSEATEKKDICRSADEGNYTEFYQLNLFETMDIFNTS
ncbi:MULTISPECIES: hypothetical protein [Streptococcus]|uniref:Uncharacterized protein n=2 Tax=Streptococcus TaxID=1301 RepID=A0AAD3A3U4_STRAG|nr:MULTISPECIES: hypothetical protein [Streptococcus]EPU31268.1 hypothetical protein SAG0161_00825 [Streptococcus agalactiae MRI Z1-213]EPU36755.1 hypothetical protein SAG0162_05410 [Streptococcus agalactiae MRI Z1-214]EPU39649.1 hypothetical protein SAG0164_06630 [Streptococcus agalactiae MRI Z1-216]EPX05931.1 hypothetical protein SAG0165_02050 [Streptococcus agalactiae MRI Z1-217]VTS33486.1 Uncharacterised protein [Streptococcus pseudoporcinus]